MQQSGVRALPSVSPGRANTKDCGWDRRWWALGCAVAEGTGEPELQIQQRVGAGGAPALEASSDGRQHRLHKLGQEVISYCCLPRREGGSPLRRPTIDSLPIIVLEHDVVVLAGTTGLEGRIAPAVPIEQCEMVRRGVAKLSKPFGSPLRVTKISEMITNRGCSYIFQIWLARECWELA